MWVSVLAAAGTLPLVMMYFNQVSVVGVAANLVVVPLLGWLVIPLGLAGVPILMFSPALAYACWQCAGFGLEAVLAVVAWIAGRPFAAFHTVTPTVLEVILYYGCFVLVLNWKKMRRPALVLTPILTLAVADGAYWYYQRFGCRDLRVTALDVGQGSANLIQLPGGQTVLVDGGGFSDNSTFDVGRLLVAPYLWRLKIKTVDLVVLTHPNSDHLNGLIYILKHFHVPHVWSNHEAADTYGYRQWQEVIRENGIMHPAFERLDRKQALGGVTFEILAPEPGFLQRRSSEPWRNENENSLVLKVSLGDVSFLLCGDIGYRAEKHLVKICNGRQLQSTVLLVPHHGSRFASSAVFLHRVRPEQAVISAGWRNRYGFPHTDVLRRLGNISCKVWRTDQSGAVLITTDGTEYSVRTVITSR
jgi:competence protein ComEC